MTQTTLREYLRTTEDAISSGRIDEAMANCQNILTYFPEALEAQRLLGEVYLAQGHLEEAQQTFEWVLSNDPENVIVYCDRALISERTSDIDTALDCYQQAYELSRGNANIRQEFNQLSARVGQQEFMFSRAGLARLYMRGDLLTQAMQEWDAVLAISPERLDARLGLMETYWREGLYDKAETIAQQLLEEIPTCLKALLFLAHMTSISHLQRAGELLQRAQALDPDLAMAQEIFADLAARQPHDPFLELLNKEPILLENGIPLQLPPLASQAQVASASTAPAPASQETASSRQEMEPISPPAPDTLLAGGTPDQPEPLSWQEMTESPTTTRMEQPWYQHEEFTGSNGTAHRDPEASPAGNWSTDIQEEPPVHPAWLDTLTRNDQPPAAATPGQAPVEQPEATTSASQTPATTQNAPVRPTEEAMPFFFPVEDETENDMGWPEWLKSLGAQALEPEENRPSEPLPEIDATPVRIHTRTPERIEEPRPAEAALPSPSENDPWAALPSMSASNETWTPPDNQPAWLQQIAPGQNATPDWMQQFAATQPPAAPESQSDWMHQLTTGSNPPLSEQEQQHITSLADLEKDLQSQGFVPLAPGSLATIAQQESQAQPIPFEPTPSSALARLGNFPQPPDAPATDDPWWQSMPPRTDEQPTEPHPAIERSQNPFAALGAKMSDMPGQPLSTPPATPTPTPVIQNMSPAHLSADLTPAYRSDALLDSDLETTMKRPAITLQPLPPGAAHNTRSYSNGQGYSERRHSDHSDEGNPSNHERLVRGYQHQLSGAYEEAMQDYRVIIRQAPELLEDVISNMRALLKITPRFSLGYRVLGDAYMRKGEYLQAMEAYNKALTMAKKARN
ncbi:MAG TPA: tetratricopeptide repeat protein [Ktedonobacteraceae bacterium]